MRRRDMTIAVENAQLFGEKYEHLNGADTWPFPSLPNMSLPYNQWESGAQERPVH